MIVQLEEAKLQLNQLSEDSHELKEALNIDELSA